MVSLRSAVGSLVFLGVVLGAVACGSSTTVTERVFVKATIGPASSDPGSCGLETGTDWLSIGSVDSSGTYTPVDDGSNDNGASVHVDCLVTPNSDGFTVNITTNESGATNGGTVSISGAHFTNTGVQTGITATFAKTSIGTFTASDCTVTYADQYMGVAAGRVWGILDCPDATYAAQSRTCDTTAEFRFENCNQ